MSRQRTKGTEVHGKSRYQKIISDGRELEAVFRLQTAHSTKQCEADNCPLGREIKVFMDYVRVYYPDTNEVEIMHAGCFRREFKPDA